MKTRVKTVSALELKKQETIDLLDETEIKIGNQLLNASSSAVEKEISVQFNANASHKQEILHKINDVEQLVQRLKDIREQSADTKKCMVELDSLADLKYEELGETLFKERNDSFPVTFAHCCDDAAKEYDEAESLKQQIDSMQESSEKSSFVSKVVIQMKLPALKTSYSVHLKKYKQILGQGVKALFDSGFNDAKVLNVSESAEKIFDGCLNFIADSQKKKNLLQSETQETSSIKAELLTLGVSDSSGKKRIAQLRSEIQKIEVEQAELCHEAGKTYANLYCTKQGEPILECTGMCADLIEVIQTERANLVSYNRRVEIMKLTAAQEEAEKKIASFKQNAAEIRQRISTMEENIKLIEEKIGAAAAARDTIVSKRALLENEESSSVKLIKEKVDESKE